MHSKEMSWKSLIWLFVLMPIVAPVVLIGIVAVFVPAATGKMLAEIDWLSPQPYLVLILYYVFYGPPLIFALPMRQHERLRRRAMAGDAAAMRLVAAQPKQRPPDDFPDEPIRLHWKRWGKVCSITATTSGIVAHRAPRKDVSLNWNEVALIEHWRDMDHSMGYCVYGNDGRFIEWPDRSRLGTRIIDPTPDLIGQRQDALLGMVTTRTGLPLRTLDVELALPDETRNSASSFRLLIRHVSDG